MSQDIQPGVLWIISNGEKDIRKKIFNVFGILFNDCFSSERFGLYYVDFENESRPRTAKNSAKYYKQVISTKCILEDGSCVSE